jgi:hypothetical protein
MSTNFGANLAEKDAPFNPKQITGLNTKNSIVFDSCEQALDAAHRVTAIKHSCK